MPQVTQSRLAWTLFGVTVVLLAASAVIGPAGGETWGATLGFIPTSITFAAVAGGGRRGSGDGDLGRL
jgi:hypothetical protein